MEIRTGSRHGVRLARVGGAGFVVTCWCGETFEAERLRDAVTALDQHSEERVDASD